MDTNSNRVAPFVGRLSFVERSASGFERVTMAGEQSELWLVATVTTTQRVYLTAHEIAIELLRGECFRDRVVYRAVLDVDRPWRRAFRIQHGTSCQVSSRLIASLRVDGQELASARLLVNAVRFDAQGRLLSAPVATEATRIAYADEFEHWLDRGEKVSEPKHPTS